MPVERMRMRPWLEEQINSQAIPGLRWINKEQKIFQIPWKHAAHQGFDVNRDACLFKNWAVHTGKHRPDREGDPKSWKTNFRCALNSLPDVKELRDKSKKKGENAYRVYVMLPARERHKRRKGSLPKSDKLNGMAPDNDQSGAMKAEGGSEHRQRVHIKLENCRLLTSSQIQKMLCDSLIDKSQDDDNHNSHTDTPATHPGHSSHHHSTFPEHRPDLVAKASELPDTKPPGREMPLPALDDGEKLNNPSVFSLHLSDLAAKQEFSPQQSVKAEQEADASSVLYTLQPPLVTRDCGHGNLAVLAAQRGLQAGASVAAYGLQEMWRCEPQPQHHTQQPQHHTQQQQQQHNTQQQQQQATQGSPAALGTQEPTSTQEHEEEVHSTASADVKEEMFYPEWSQMVEVETENPESDDSYNLQISSGASSEDDSDMETNGVNKSSQQTSRAQIRHLRREILRQRHGSESQRERATTALRAASSGSSEEHAHEAPSPHADNAQYLQSRRTTSVIVRLANGKPGTDSDTAWPGDTEPGCERREQHQHRPEQEDQTEAQRALNQEHHHHQHRADTTLFHADKIQPAWVRTEVPSVCSTTAPFLSSDGFPGTTISYMWPSPLTADAAGRHEIVVIPQGHVLGLRSNMEYLVIPHHQDSAAAVIHG